MTSSKLKDSKFHRVPWWFSEGVSPCITHFLGHCLYCHEFSSLLLCQCLRVAWAFCLLLRGPCFETCGFRMDGSQWAIPFSMDWKRHFRRQLQALPFLCLGVSRWIFGRPGFFNGRGEARAVSPPGLGSVWIHWPFWVRIHLSMFEVFRCFLVGLWGISVFS